MITCDTYKGPVWYIGLHNYSYVRREKIRPKDEAVHLCSSRDISLFCFAWLFALVG